MSKRILDEIEMLEDLLARNNGLVILRLEDDGRYTVELPVEPLVTGDYAYYMQGQGLKSTIAETYYDLETEP